MRLSPLSSFLRGWNVAGRHDQAARRKGIRKQRERGLSVYIPGEQLDALGIGRHVDAIYYRTWPGPKRTSPSVIVQLYLEP